MDRFKVLPKSKISKLPKTTGVYCFMQKPKPNTQHLTPIYIGKAVNIRSRVKNHFFQPTYRDNLFIKKVTKIGFIETDSEIEALVLESKLIKKYLPKFNVVWRDDKNYFYVALRHFMTQDKLKVPYVFITHQPTQLKAKSYKLKANYIGPFVDGGAVKKTLKFLRKVFPFYTSARHPKNQCTWCHLGLCPGPRLFEARLASSANEAANSDLSGYNKNIKKLILILQGKRKTVLKSLRKEMSRYAKSGVARKNSSYKKDFEKAAKIRNQIIALEKIISHAKVINGTIWTRSDLVQIGGGRWEGMEGIERLLQKFLDINHPIKRIECYDVSNIQGKSATGSMVVFINGKPDKSQYKRFRIKMEQEPNDIAMLKEILTRRFNHPEWGYPEVILIDGGKGQLNSAIKCKNQKSKCKMTIQNLKFIKVISIAKGKQELFVEGKKQPIPLKTLPQEVYNLIKYLDDEAHRFAITYHKKLRKEALGLVFYKKF